MSTGYTVVLEQADDGSWGAYVPDLPGCTAGGATSDEAIELRTTSYDLFTNPEHEPLKVATL